jgi:phosphoribosylaminoimidazole-succinocarboxamide synthase
VTESELKKRLKTPFLGVELPDFPEPHRGKVRDSYSVDGRRFIVTTDRVSAFDRVLGTIPFKGQVLNELTNWWFQMTEDIVSNHLVEPVHPNAIWAREAEPIRVEVVVRAFLTGSSKTSLWTLYEKGEEGQYGVTLPAGLQKNSPLPEPLLTPTTKDESDRPLRKEDVVEQGLATADVWEQVQDVAIRLFRRGQDLADKAGLVLVDTKYEFGLIDGQVVLIDEVHTPDSSRYWVKGTEGQPAPLHQDKEVLRLWLREQGFQGDGEAPTIPEDLAVRLAQHYLDTFQRLTGREFLPPTEGVREALEGVAL